MPTIIYQNEQSVQENDAGLTLLQISLKHGIPHVHDCGGHARCSTCRVMIHEGIEYVCPRTLAEQTLAAKKGLAENIRLACQTTISGPVRIRRLVLDETDSEMAQAESSPVPCQEKNIAVLFSDLADFTTISEHQLPYDIVHMLNRYFHATGEAVIQNHGYIDKYIGDSLMALFGLTCNDPGETCMNAVRSALEMLDRLHALNLVLKKTFGVEFGMRIGIHFGEAVIGEMGHPKKLHFTAIGDTVNVASRIEGASKGTGARLLISDAVHEHIKDRIETGIEVTRELKGKSGTYRLYEVLRIKPG